jgi:threonine synthase
VIEKVDGKQIGDAIDIILPTGAMGSIAGGEIARRLGLPIRKYCLAVNANDITHQVMQTDQFHKFDAMIKTLSDAITIQLVSLQKTLTNSQECMLKFE